MPSTHQFCTFFIDGHCFGTSVAMVKEVIQFQPITRVPLAPDVIVGLMNLRGQIVSVMDLRRRLEFPACPCGQRPVNVVVQARDSTVSLLVDEIGDVIEVQEDTFEAPPVTLQGFVREMLRGVYKLPERLLLLLDIERVVDLENFTHGSVAAIGTNLYKARNQRGECNEK